MRDYLSDIQCDYQIIPSLPNTHNINTKNTSEYTEYCSIPPQKKQTQLGRGGSAASNTMPTVPEMGAFAKQLMRAISLFLEHTKARFLSCMRLRDANPPTVLVVNIGTTDETLLRFNDSNQC